MSNKRNSQKIFLSNVFVRLNINDFIILVTIRVKRTKDIKILMKYIDASDIGYIFFGYEMLEMQRYHTCDPTEQRPYRFCLVLMYKEQTYKDIEEYFRQEQLCMLQNMQLLSIGSLYRKMSSQTIRVSNRIFFERMRLDSFEQNTIKNIFARLFLNKNILCLSSIDLQLKNLQSNLDIIQHDSHLQELFDQQKKLQLYIDGQYYIDMQIYFPFKHRNIIYFLIDNENQKHEDICKEYIRLSNCQDKIMNKVHVEKRQRDLLEELDLVKEMQRLMIKDRNLQCICQMGD